MILFVVVINAFPNLYYSQFAETKGQRGDGLVWGDPTSKGVKVRGSRTKARACGHHPLDPLCVLNNSNLQVTHEESSKIHIQASHLIISRCLLSEATRNSKQGARYTKASSRALCKDAFSSPAFALKIQVTCAPSLRHQESPVTVPLWLLCCVVSLRC